MLTNLIERTSRKIEKYHPVLLAVIVVFLVVLLTLLMIKIFSTPSNQYFFTQNSWTQDNDSEALASHDINRDNWVNFSEIDNLALLEDGLKIKLIESNVAQETRRDFEEGSYSGTILENIEEESEIGLAIFDVFEDGNVISVSSGISHTCAVSNTGYVYCWGQGVHGQLGNGNDKDSLTPVRVHAGRMNETDDEIYLSNIKSVSAGNYHTCAISKKENLYCWGHGLYGKNGNNSTENSSVPVRVHGGEAENEDTENAYITNIKSVSAGADHTCAVSNAGHAYCWGKGLNGQLGNGEDKDKLSPSRVIKGEAVPGDTSGTYLTNIKDISSGADHTCAVSNRNNPYCWGHRERLGNNSEKDSPEPVFVLKGEARLRDSARRYLLWNIRSISAGDYHTCAVSNTNNAYCWGYGHYGQLGNGKEFNEIFPVRIRADKREVSSADTIQENREDYFSNTKSIHVGSLHTCAVSNAGHAYCWGKGLDGQLGNSDDTKNRSTPIRVHLGEGTQIDKDNIYLSNISIISPSREYSCAASNNNHIYCWGRGDFGRLGNNNNRNHNVPVRPKKHDSATFFELVRYAFSGNFVSNAIDTGQKNLEFLNLNFLASNPPGTEIRFQIRSAENMHELFNAPWHGPESEDDFYENSGSEINQIHNGDRWVQYRIFLRTSNSLFTPKIRTVSIDYKKYSNFGSLISSPYNTLNNSTVPNSIMWEGEFPKGTRVKFQLRTAPDNEGYPGEWIEWVGKDGTETSFFDSFQKEEETIIPFLFKNKRNRWFQYKVYLETDDNTKTPLLKEISIGYLQ